MVSPATLRAVLAALGAPVESLEQAEAAFAERRAQPWRRLLPAALTGARGEQSRVAAHTAAGAAPRAHVALADGGLRALATVPQAARRRIDGRQRQRHEIVLPGDLPMGRHRLVLETADGEQASAELLQAPAHCPLPPELPACWGWSAQLYALRAAAGWGIGEYPDLGALAAAGGSQGAAFVLTSPLYAVAPVPPIQASPYTPTSRRFANPLHLRPEAVPECRADDAALAAALAAAADWQATERLDRDAVWARKSAALEALFAVPREPAREEAFAAFRAREGAALERFATFCALAERHGLPFQQWPAALRDPDSAAVRAARAELDERVRFHAWLQWLCDEQLAAAAQAGLDAGLAVGLVTDLPLGVDAGGADAWAAGEELATDCSLGAPPDAFNPAGQDWGLPPLQPERLADTAGAGLRAVLAAALRHAGGVRIDHVLGLFRQFWIPRGAPPSAGTYVTFPAETLLRAVALTAWEHQGLVIGEDLGTVAPGVRDRLERWGVLGCRVLYFERDADGHPAPAAAYTSQALASVGTHDLPTLTGWWHGHDLTVQAEAGVLDPAELPAARERRATERAELLALLAGHGLLGTEEPDEAALMLAVHRFLARTPSWLVVAALGDALGDPRQPNLPGTTTAYPNWRLPLATGPATAPSPVTLEQALAHSGVAALAAALGEERPRDAPATDLPRRGPDHARRAPAG